MITGLNVGILFTDYQIAQELFGKRTVFIELERNVAHADGAVVEDTASQVKQTSRESIKESPKGKEQSSTLGKAGNSELEDVIKKYRLNRDEFNKITSDVKKISDEMNFDWKIVIAIMLTESKGGVKMVGDSGLSKGYYHIYHVNVCELNGNKPNCIKDADRSNLEASTRWTISRLKRHAILGETEMIRSHNGLIADHSNDWYTEYVLKLTREL